MAWDKELQKEVFRDNMSDLEVAFADLWEIATREISKKQKPYGLEQNKKVARDDIERNLGENVVTKNW